MRKSRNRIEPAFAASYDDVRAASSFDRKDSIATLCAVLAMAAIITNALFLQRGPHPAPILVNRAPPSAAAPAPVTGVAAERKDAVVLPRPRPADMETAKPEPMKVEATANLKSDALPRLVRMIPLPEAGVAARRVSTVQRVLSEYGYGQIKPTGNLDRETQDAIEQFERAKKLPVTRQITPVLMRELAALAGRPLE